MSVVSWPSKQPSIYIWLVTSKRRWFSLACFPNVRSRAYHHCPCTLSLAYSGYCLQPLFNIPSIYFICTDIVKHSVETFDLFGLRPSAITFHQFTSSAPSKRRNYVQNPIDLLTCNHGPKTFHQCISLATSKRRWSSLACCHRNQSTSLATSKHLLSSLACCRRHQSTSRNIKTPLG